MARCGCGGSRCSCSLVAGDGITVDGSGSPSVPWVISANPAPLAVDTSDTCVTLSGNGTTGAPLAASLRLDPNPSNTLACGPNGLLATGSGSVAAGCGLTGSGSAGAPLAAATSAWPYPCDVTANAGGVYCDSNGVLRSEPRGRTFYTQDVVNEFPNNPPVPATYPTVVSTRTLQVTNPDPCRPAFLIIETELDVDVTLPPGGTAAYGLPGDEQVFRMNTGTSTQTDVHTQVTKVFSGAVPAGGSFTYTLEVALGKGSGGATYNKIQSFIRAFGIVL